MHEFSLAHSILTIVLETAETNKAVRVREVHCTIGALRQVVPSLMHTAFEACCDGTIAENAVLKLEIEPVKVTCNECEQVTESDAMVYQCPRCDGVDIELDGGREMVLTSLTIDQENDHED